MCIKIKAEEKELLKKYLQTCPVRLMRLKSQAVLMKDKGMAVGDIADILSRSVNAINRWFRDWHRIRLGSIFSGHKDNENAAKLTKKQKEQVAQILQQPPSDYGLTKAFWDVPSLKAYVQATFGIVYESDQSYHFLLKFSQLSFKYPDTFDRKRNKDEIDRQMKKIYSEIQPLMVSDEWEVFVSDEVRIELETQARRAWLKRGERTILKVDRTKEAQNYIGFLNQKTYCCNLFELEWQNQDNILDIMPSLLANHPDKRICIIWDNAQFHKGKKIREALKTGNLLERVHLINLPPYAPDMNPIERVWNAAKKSISNKQFNLFEQTKHAFSSFVKSRRFQYQF